MTNPRNATTDARGNRLYAWRGESFFSVTTILNGGIPKPALTYWSANSVAEYVCDNLSTVRALIEADRDDAYDFLKRTPWRQRDKAADLGTEIHEAVEAYALGKPYPPWKPLVKPRMESFVAFLTEYQPTYELTEASVFNRTEKYAGTLDSIGTFPTLDGMRILWDVKTGGKQVYPEAAIQLAAYRRAEFVGAPDGSEQDMPEVDRCAVLHLPDAGGFEFVEVDAGEDAFRTFIFAREIHRWQSVISKAVLLGPLKPMVPSLFGVAPSVPMEAA